MTLSPGRELAATEALILSRPLGPVVPMPEAAIAELRRVFGVT